MKSKRIIACVFLLIVAFFTATNFHLALQPAKDFVRGRRNFVSFRDEIQSVLKSDEFSYKNSFINLNGLFSKLTGKRIINETLLANNGMLAHGGLSRFNIGNLAQRITALDAAAAKMGIPFLYVQAPYKMDAQGMMLPAGTSNYAHENTLTLSMLLEQNQVEALDMMTLYSDTIEHIEEYFFVTDHHWNFHGAFQGYTQLALRLQQMLGDTADISLYLDERNWTTHAVEDAYLGSLGRRVGLYVAGLDDIVYYTPGFDTEMSFVSPKHRELYKGSFSDAVMRMKLLDNGGDFFKSNTYAIYTGGNLPLGLHRNAAAPIDAKVLLIKDSFGLPVQAFLSTVFSEIDALDPREFDECSLTEYIFRTQPDAVVMMINPSVMSAAINFNYGAQDAPALLAGPQPVCVFEQEEKDMGTADYKYAYSTVFRELKPDTAYTLCFDDVRILAGETQGVHAALLNNADKPVISWTADIDYARANGGFRWAFCTPETGAEDLRLVVYNGECRETEGMHTVYENVRLYEGYLTE